MDKIIEEKKIEEIISFFSRESLYRTLKLTLSMLIGGDVVDFILLPYGGSYTDIKNKIVVGLMDFLYKLSFEELYIVILAMLGHEAQHWMSTNIYDYQNFIEAETEKLVKQGVNRSFAKSITSYVGNAVEDGRIEIILINNYRGFKPKLQFLNILIRENGELTEESDEFSALTSSILTISKLNLLPINYNKYFLGTDIDKVINKVRPLILEAHTKRTSKECFNVCSEIMKVITPEIIKVKNEAENNWDWDKMQELIDKLSEGVNEENFTESKDEVTNDKQGETIYIPIPMKEKNSEEDNHEGKGGSGESLKEDSEEKSESIGAKKDEEKKDESLENKTENQSPDTKKDSSKDKGESSNSKDSTEDNSGADNKDSENTDLSSGLDGGEAGEPEAFEENFVDEMMRKIQNELESEATDAVSNARRDETKEMKTSSPKEENLLTDKDIKDIMKNSSGKDIYFEEIKRNYELTHDMITELKVSSGKFKRDIEKIFLNRNSADILGQEKGVLNPDDLYRVSMGDYNIFSIEGRKAKSDYVVYILKDGSGSMSGEKELNAGYALSIIEEGLKDVVPLKLVDFRVNGRTVTHNEIKGWNDKSSKNYSYNFMNNRRAGGYNEDGISIRIATAELLKRPEKDKVLIVLSDGLPASIEDTKKAIKDARKKHIHLVGIMFGSESFRQNSFEKYKDMYEKNIIATSPNMIPKKLTETLKKILIR